MPAWGDLSSRGKVLAPLRKSRAATKVLLRRTIVKVVLQRSLRCLVSTMLCYSISCCT